jgi:hypothetical protein
MMCQEIGRDVSRDWKRCVEIIRRLFLPTVNIYGGGAWVLFYGAAAPVGLSNVVPAVGGRNPRGTPPDIVLNV